MPDSQSQVGLAGAVMAGKAKESGMSKTYAREVLRKMKGRKMAGLPKHTGEKSKGKRYYERAKGK